MFFVLGATTGSWAARIPAIKGGLHLSAGTLGLVLLGPAIGSMLTMPVTGALLASVSPRRLVQIGVLGISVMLPLSTFAGSAWELFAVLVGWGAGIGTMDVAMNTEAAAVQEHLFSFLLVIGLASRLSALGLLGMTAVIEVFVYPENWPDHLLWTACLLYVIARGPGGFSLDGLIRKRLS